MVKEDVFLKIRPVVEAQMEKGGFVLVDARCYKDRENQLVLEILADRADGGITMDECVRLNREVGGLLEQADFFQKRYVLDVSSPGLDRPLVTKADFRRYIGSEVRLFLKEAWEDKVEYNGEIVAVEEADIIMNTDKKTIHIPWDKINKAKQVIL
jgi:ribosome maturation factor RimP